MRLSIVCIALLATTAPIIAQGCDVRKQALSIFGKQGLNLLRPARDYVVPGGLVFIGKNGVAEYDDPIERVVTEPGNLTNFRAVILQETQKKSTGFATAMDLTNWILPAPIGLRSSSNREVTLAGIETTGIRLQTTAVDNLIKRASTAKATVPELKRGLRVFVVQEIYKATSVDLRATSATRLDIAFNDGSAVATCAGGKPEEPKATASTGGSKAGDTKGPDEQRTDTKAAETKVGEAKAATAKAQNTTTKPAATDPAGVPAQKAGDSSNGKALPSIGVSVCSDQEYTLRLRADNPIPFAVRLAELEIGGGQLRRRRGVASMNTSLGAGEIAAARISDAEPIVDNLSHRQR